MRQITPPQILTFFALLSVILTLGLGTTWLLLGGLPLGDFRGVALVFTGVVLVYLYAFLVYRLFLHFVPLQEGELAEGSRAEFAAQVGERVFGAGNVLRDVDPTMGSEDFAFLLEARPGAYVFLGQGGADGGCLLHNPHYDFNDAVIPLGAGYLAALAEGALGRGL